MKLLIAKVSLEAGGQVTRVTGIPPHIETAVLCSRLVRMCKDTLREIRELTATIKEAVSEAFEEKALKNGHMTSEKLKELFEDYHAQVVKAIDEQISSIKVGRLISNEEDSNSVNEDYPLLDGCVDEVVRSDNDVMKYKLYTYDGKFWHVPKDFCFSKRCKALNRMVIVGWWSTRK